jgi:hypothetical protein
MNERLEPVRGVQVISRGVYEIDYAGHSYTVEVDYFDVAEKVHLYRDGARIATEKSPARFELDGGATIEAQMGLLGMKRLRLVEPGRETQLQPATGTAEAGRAAFERDHPLPPLALGALGVLALAAALDRALRFQHNRLLD